MNLLSDLEATLARLADAVEGATSEPWWIIGSAAVALHGAALTDIRDIDLMMGLADAQRLLARLGLQPEPDSHHRQFRSELFAVWREPPLPVEIFAAFRIADPEGWRPVAFQTRQAIRVAGRMLYVPSVDELHDLLLTFGRPKDLERARLLHSISGTAPPFAPASLPDRHRSSS